jgi:hypothetical protein
MVYTQSLEPQLSQLELRVLGFLNQRWPSTATVTPHIVPAAESADRAAFVEAIQSLSDNGLISYEAFLMGTGSSLRFVETMITARGRAALRTPQFAA